MNRPVRTVTGSDEVRALILEVAEEHFRRVGYHRTSVADIASELRMSPANVYRFFRSRDAINESICGRVLEEVTEIAFAIASSNAPATEKLDKLLTAVHQHNKMTLVKERRMHELIVAAMHENWAVIKAHMERLLTIFEAIIREGAQTGEFEVEDAAEAARAVNAAFMPFFHPTLIEHCLQCGEDPEAGLRVQIRFILKALGRSDQAVCLSRT
ncbi:TetR/AcrR family transcriptional regulator [Bradyrhizobium sp. 160]|uniref:TetR/AcrR family transcriptional regulator n=1 Tax=unclassified Bradyrhizobium TaxID=2631580 RepID=UPI001FF7562D|nr:MULTISPECIES: TetR/AcrR family transcriptional regulator [unclassified Bradyrhizobium]MCK1546528.1 TetR/AcrR family transcriptional regulator [Bradyrhizobium sp. 179]MCK1624259.1 TetR/AcrR family transcriptional regulator [Bradyrhizobium sp. 160]